MPAPWSVNPSTLRFTFGTGRGPGGQNVNKVATRAILRVGVRELGLDPATEHRLRALASSRLTKDDELLFDCGESRSQGANKDECVRRLEELVRRAMIVPKIRRPTKPTRGSKERRLESKKRAGRIKASRRFGQGEE